MKSLKEQILSDIDSVFFNLDEFGEEHMIEGKLTNIVVDNEKLQELKLDAAKSGVIQDIDSADTLFFIKKSDIEKNLNSGSLLNFDGKENVVVSNTEINGVNQIIIAQYRSV